MRCSTTTMPSPAATRASTSAPTSSSPASEIERGRACATRRRPSALASRRRSEARPLPAGLGAPPRAEPSHGTIDWYHHRAAEAAKRKRPLLAQAYLSEAAALASRTKDRYRLDEAAAAPVPAPVVRSQRDRR